MFNMDHFPCDLCSKTYSKVKELIAHRKHCHTTAPNYNCPLCDEEFVMKRDLMRHRKISHGFESLRCDICNKEYFSKASLRYHLKTHARPYHCESCQRFYEDKNSFAKHMRKSHNIEITETENAGTRSQFNHVSAVTSATRNKKASPMVATQSCDKNARTSLENTNANRSKLKSSCMTRSEVENTEYCVIVLDTDSESDSNESNGSYSCFRPTCSNHNLSVEKSQISNNGSTHSVDQLNTNCQHTNELELMSSSELQSNKVKTIMHDTNSTSSGNHEGKASHHTFRPSPNSHSPSLEIICIEDTKDAAIDYISSGDKIDNNSTPDASQYYAPSPEYTKVGEFGFKESANKNFESNCGGNCIDAEHNSENIIEMTSNNAILIEVQRETCVDTLDHSTLPCMHLDNLSPSANDRKICWDGDQQRSDDKIPVSNKKWEESKNCHVTFKDMLLFSKHKASCSAALVEQQNNNSKLAKSIESKDNHLEHMASSQVIDLTEESHDKEMFTEQVSLKENTTENSYLDAFNSSTLEEDGNQCIFCDNVFQDISTLQAHQEKCFMAITTQRLSKNAEITYTCKICKTAFKSLLSYEVHEMSCSRSLGTADVHTSKSGCSHTTEQDLNEMNKSLLDTSQTDLLTNSEKSSPSESPISILSGDQIESEYRLPSDHHQNTTEKKTMLQSEIEDEMQYIPKLEEFQCIHCTMKFQTHEEHHKHELSHELMADTPTGITYICIVCGNSFDMIHKIIHHVSIHKSQPTVE